MNEIKSLYTLWKQGDYLDKDILESLERSMSFQNVIDILKENERLTIALKGAFTPKGCIEYNKSVDFLESLKRY